MSFTSISELVDEFLRRLEKGDVCNCELGYHERGDSILEERFWHMVRKTSLGWHGAAAQVKIGRYRVDAIFDCDGKAVVVECDGKAFHDLNADRVRDAELLHHVDAIIRIPYAALWYYRYASFEILSTWFPRFKILTPCTALTDKELEDEREGVERDYYEDCYQTVDEWMLEIEPSYDVWKVDGNIGWVGSPRQFLVTSPKVFIHTQYGQAEAGIIDRIYDAGGCSPLRRLEKQGVA